jgi:cytochrome P450
VERVTTSTISSGTPELQLDLLEPTAVIDPYPVLERLRVERPVHWSDAHKAWMILGYDDVARAFGDTTVFSSNRISPLLETGRITDEAVAGVMKIMAYWMVVSDPPVHTRLRKLITDAFKPSRMYAMEDSIRGLADGLLDDYAAGTDRNIVTAFSYPFPSAVIAELVGAPQSDRAKLQKWSNAFSQVAFGGEGEGDPERHEKAFDGLQNMITYFLGRIEATKEEPADHLIGNCLRGADDGDRLTDYEIAGMCALLLFAGHETSANLISSLLLALQQHPDQKALVEADIAAVTGAVEEGLRFDGPVKALARWCTEDVELNGTTIKANSKVYIVLAAANRDPEKFVDPDRFDITRNPNPHIGFGRGVHTCIGALLARLETRIAVTRIFERYPEFRIDEASVRWEVSREARALHTLEIDLGAPA